VKSFGILALFLLAGNVALSQTATATLPVCSSGPHVIIDAKQLAGNANDVFVDVYQVMGKHQILYRSYKADAKGIADLREVPVGDYRAFADNGKDTSKIRLLIIRDYKAATCELKPQFPGIFNPFRAKTVVMKEVRGIVQIPGVPTSPRPPQAPAPDTKVSLLRDGADRSDALLVQTDKEGRFAFPKASDGWYWLTAEPSKELYRFCRVSVRVQVAQKGWEGLKLSLVELVSVAPGFCERASKIESLNGSKN
jgi:hypothetical protein